MAVFVVAVLAGVGLSATVAGGQPILAARWGLLIRLGVWAIAWLVAVAAALRLPRRLAIWLIVAAALALRLAALAGPPTTSDDLYRYAWDGRAQVSGSDPYAEPPLSPQLAGARESWLWPNEAGCAALHRPPGCTRINRPAVRTIYPPVAEAWFAAVYRVGGIAGQHKPWQIAGLATETATIGLLLVALRRYGRDPRLIALYALSPVPVLEIVNNGHVDGLAIALLAGALVVAAGSTHPTRRQVIVGLLIGLAALVKLYPALLLLAVAGMAGGRPRPGAGRAGAESTGARPRPGAGRAGAESTGARPRPGEGTGGSISAGVGPSGDLAIAGSGSDGGQPPWHAVARAVAAAGALAVIAYLPHVLAVGWRVVGYLPGYLQEEHYDQGGRFLLAGLLGLPGPATMALAAAALLGMGGWVLWRRPPFPQAAALLLAALFLTVTPVQPWYATALIAVAVVSGWPWWAAVAGAGYPYFFAVILDNPHAVGLGRVGYGAALAVLVAAGRVRCDA